MLTHWGRATHICIGNLTNIGSENGLSPDRRQAIIWTNAGLLLIGPLGTNFSEILIEILAFSFKKMRLKVSSAKWRPFCLSLDVSVFVPYVVSVFVPYVCPIKCVHGLVLICFIVVMFLFLSWYMWSIYHYPSGPLFTKSTLSYYMYYSAVPL